MPIEKPFLIAALTGSLLDVKALNVKEERDLRRQIQDLRNQRQLMADMEQNLRKQGKPGTPWYVRRLQKIEKARALMLKTEAILAAQGIKL